SRRRHTGFSRDWSSDVCSSDLARVEGAAARAGARPLVGVERVEHRRQVLDDVAYLQLDLVDQRSALLAVPLELLQRALRPDPLRSEERRVGKECGTRWSAVAHT